MSGRAPAPECWCLWTLWPPGLSSALLLPGTCTLYMLHFLTEIVHCWYNADAVNKLSHSSSSQQQLSCFSFLLLSIDLEIFENINLLKYGKSKCIVRRSSVLPTTTATTATSSNSNSNLLGVDTNTTAASSRRHSWVTLEMADQHQYLQPRRQSQL